MKTETLTTTHPQAVQYAVDVLRHKGLVAFPTDTVYGLAALPEAAAVEHLLAAKGHSMERAIAILIGQLSDWEQVAHSFPAPGLALAQAFWPGPLTLVVPQHPALPAVVCAAGGVGLRLPAHAFAQRLLAASGPLAVSSANRTGEAFPRTAAAVQAQLQGRVDLILDGGPTPGGQPSTIVDCTQALPQVLRAGPITAEQIAAVLAPHLPAS